MVVCRWHSGFTVWSMSVSPMTANVHTLDTFAAVISATQNQRSIDLQQTLIVTDCRTPDTQAYQWTPATYCIYQQQHPATNTDCHRLQNTGHTGLPMDSCYLLHLSTTTPCNKHWLSQAVEHWTHRPTNGHLLLTAFINNNTLQQTLTVTGCRTPDTQAYQWTPATYCVYQQHYPPCTGCAWQILCTLWLRSLKFMLTYIYILNVKTYQFTTPCKSDEVTHPKQHKSFFLG